MPITRHEPARGLGKAIVGRVQLECLRGERFHQGRAGQAVGGVSGGMASGGQGACCVRVQGEGRGQEKAGKEGEGRGEGVKGYQVIGKTGLIGHNCKCLGAQS